MIETWFKLLLASLIPVAVAMFLPRPVRPYLVAAAAVLLIAAIVAFVRQERTRRSDPE